MKKFFLKSLVTLLALAGFVATSNAQDLFAQTRAVVLSSPTTLNTIGTALTTNGPIDVRQFDKKIVIDIFSVTNAANAVITATFQTSDDKTNYVAIPNYAVSTATSISFTNYWNGYSNVVSQTTLMPGVYTTPAASTSGWSTPYLLANSYTNSGALDVSKNGVTRISYPVEAGRQYLRVIWTQSGGAGATNVVVGAVATGVGTFNGW